MQSRLIVRAHSFSAIDDFSANDKRTDSARQAPAFLLPAALRADDRHHRTEPVTVGSIVLGTDLRSLPASAAMISRLATTGTNRMATRACT